MTVEPLVSMAVWVSLTLLAAALLGWYALGGRRRVPGRRWWVIVGLMAAAMAVPLVVLLNPVQVRPVPPPAGKPLLTVLVDRSASMATRDVGTEKDGARDGNNDSSSGANAAGRPALAASAAGKTVTSRYDEACRIASRMAESLADRYEIQVVSFAEETTPGSPESLAKDSPKGAATDLASAVEEVLVDRPQGQSVLVLSDGVHNATIGTTRLAQSVARAKAMAVPLLVHGIGGEADVDDLAVSLNLPQELAFVGQRAPVVVRLKQRGKAAVEAKVSLRLAGKTIDERKVTLAPDGTVQATFRVSQPTTGLYRYEIHAEPRSPAGATREATKVNNTATLLVRVVDEPIRVLLLEGKPYWDTKFLVRTLSTDKSIELVSLVRTAPGRLLRRTITHTAKSGASGAPLRSGPGTSGSGSGTPSHTVKSGPHAEREEYGRLDRWAVAANADEQLGSAAALGRFQIVVLGRDADVFLTDDVLIRLKKWLVEGEGSLVCFRGPPSSQINQRLAELMPVRWTPERESRFRVEMSEAGKSLEWLAGAEGQIELAELPSLAAVARAERPKPLAVVLATAVDPRAKQHVPVISYQPVGNGRVVVIEGAGMWRWAFLPGQYEKHDESYGILWRSLMRWLVSGAGLLPSQEFALRTDRVTFGTNETVTATLLVNAQRAASPPKVELAGGDLKEPRVVTAVPSGNSPGQFRVVFGRLAEGTYEARVAGSADESAAAAFDVRGNLTERLDVAAKPDVLAWMAEGSGGAVLEDADPDRLAACFEKHLEQSRPRRHSRRGLWDRWWVLVGAVGIWGASWGLRRSSGLT